MALSTIQKIDRLAVDADLLHNIVHGPATGEGSTVVTEGGDVPTAAAAIDRVQSASYLAIANIEGAYGNSAADLTAAKTAALAGIQSASDAALADVASQNAAALAQAQAASVDAMASLRALVASNGYQAPVAYAGGIALTSATQTVSYNGQVFAPVQSSLPFTTNGTFEAAKFRLVQGVAGSDLADPASGAAMVGYGGVTVKQMLDAMKGSGTTAARPVALFVGQPYFDADLGLPIYCSQISPAIWVNSAGIQV